MKNILIVSALLLFASCKKSVVTADNNSANPLPTQNVSSEQLTTVYIDNPTGSKKLKCRLFIPETSAQVPAVVVMHGSGGLWLNNDTAGNVMSSQFNQWVDSFRKYKIAALFIDSYSARGEFDFKEVAPPANISLSAEFVRPRDAYSGLNFLRTLSVIKSSKIALMGFSHGATSVLSTMADASKLNTAGWSYKYNGNTYTNGVLAPAPAPAAGGFAAAVSYYPGAGFYSYFGSPSTASSGKYISYGPILLIAAGKDPLYADNNYYQTLVDKNALNGGSVAGNNYINLKIYPNAAHSFDGKSAGDDGAANTDAKNLVLNFLKSFF